MEPKSLFEEISNLLDKVSEDAAKNKYETLRQWTDAILLGLYKLGRKKGYNVCTKSTLKTGEKHEGEYLTDLLWYKEENQETKEYALIMECEWDLDIKKIVFYFEKLVIIESTYKLFICEAKEDSLEELMKKMKKIISNLYKQQVYQNYLFAIWVKDKFIYKEINLPKDHF